MATGFSFELSQHVRRHAILLYINDQFGKLEAADTPELLFEIDYDRIQAVSELLRASVLGLLSEPNFVAGEPTEQQHAAAHWVAQKVNDPHEITVADLWQACSQDAWEQYSYQEQLGLVWKLLPHSERRLQEAAMEPRAQIPDPASWRAFAEAFDLDPEIITEQGSYPRMAAKAALFASFAYYLHISGKGSDHVDIDEYLGIGIEAAN